MDDLHVITLSGAEGQLSAASVESLQTNLRGQLLLPSSDGYDVARQVWNAMIDRRPALITRCAGAADVIQSVRFAREHQLLLSVRGGGHNVAGTAVCDGGLMIDLSPMKGIRVDPIKRVARAEGGVVLGELDHETQACGLATSLGVFSPTGIAGLTLGGGIGYLSRRFGLTCDNLLSADVVTANGDLVVASDTENSDLLWGLRGGGGNFGVVTSFQYQLHRVGPTVLGGTMLYPFSHAREMLQWFGAFTRSSPEELSMQVYLVTGPEDLPVVMLGVCYSGPLQDGERLLKPLKRLGHVADAVRPMPFTAVQRMFDAGAGLGVQRYRKSTFLREITDRVADTMVAYCTDRPSSGCGAFIEDSLGGAVKRRTREETAFGHRDMEYSLTITVNALAPAEAQRGIEWARSFWEALQPSLPDGVYVNYMSEGESDARVRSAYGKNYERLVTLKTKYDPTNQFRMNQNIKPGALQ